MALSSVVPIQSVPVAVPGNDLRVIELDFHTDPRWEAFVNAHPDALVYHHPAWLQALEREYGQRCISLACVDAANDIRGILPLFQTRGIPMGFGGELASPRLSSLPRTPLAGPIAMDRQTRTRILQAAIQRLRQFPNTRLQIKTDNTDMDGLVEGLLRRPWRSSYVLELPSSPDKIRFGNRESHHRIKWAVNKARRNGLTTRQAESENELRAWYSMYLDRMRHNLVPARPYRFFLGLWDLLRKPGLMKLLLVEQQTQHRRTLIAGSIFLMFRKTFTYAFTGCYARHFSLHPNDLLQWEGIHRACEMGCRRYDFGEVPDEHQQLAQFKSKWCAEAKPLFHYYYPALGDTTKCSATAGGRMKKLVSTIWRRVPLFATATVGERFYRYL